MAWTLKYKSKEIAEAKHKEMARTNKVTRIQHTKDGYYKFSIDYKK